MYLPGFQSQLVFGIPTKGEDCAVRSGSVAVDFATRGARVPGVREFRRRAGEPTEGLTMRQVTNAIRSYDTLEETHGFTRVRADLCLGEPWREVENALEAGLLVVLAIDYAWINQFYPRKSGDPKFKGKHAIAAIQKRLRLDKWQTLVYDPLHDRRRKGIPQGPNWWRMDMLRQACDVAAPTGEFNGVIVKPSRKVA